MHTDMYMQSSSIVKSMSFTLHARPLSRTHTSAAARTSTLSRTSEAHERPSRQLLSKHDELIAANSVANGACALVATTNNIYYCAPLRLLLRDE